MSDINPFRTPDSELGGDRPEGRPLGDKFAAVIGSMMLGFFFFPTLAAFLSVMIWPIVNHSQAFVGDHFATLAFAGIPLGIVLFRRLSLGSFLKLLLLTAVMFVSVRLVNHYRPW